MQTRSLQALFLVALGLAVLTGWRMGAGSVFAQEPTPTPELEEFPLVPTPMAPPGEGVQAFGLAQAEQSTGPSEDRVVSDDPDDQIRPVVAYSQVGDVYLVVWQDRFTLGPTHIFGRYVDANGNPLGARFPVAMDRGELVQVRVVAGGGVFLVLWREGPDLASASLYVQRVSGSFTGDPLVGSPILVRSPIQRQFQAVYNPDRNEFLLLWLDARHPVLRPVLKGEVFGRRFTPGGILGVQEFNFTPVPANPSFPQILSAPTFQGDISAAYNGEQQHYLLTYASYNCSNISCTVREDVVGQRVDANALSRVGGAIGITPGVIRIQWAARALYDPRVDQYAVVWNDNRATEPDMAIFAQRLTALGSLVAGNTPIVQEAGSQLWPEWAYLDVDLPLPRYFIVWEDEPSPLEHAVRGAFLSSGLARLGETLDLSGDPEADQRFPQVASDRRSVPNFLTVWQHTRPGQSADAHAQIFSASDYVRVTLVSPTGGDMVLSLKPILRWESVPGADRYLVQWFRATDTGLIGEAFPPVVVGAEDSLDPEQPTQHRYRIPSELTSGVRLGTAGYYWSVIAQDQAGSTIAQSRHEPFQIPPLGLKPSNPYWNQFDDLIYRWSEAYDLPPALVKAVIAKETFAIAAWQNGDPPDRSYLYEPAKDYWNCAVAPSNSACRDQVLDPYRQPGAGTVSPRRLPTVNGKPWSANPTIADLAADPTEPEHLGAGISYWPGLQALTGCTQWPFVGSSFFRCVVDWFDGDPPVAQYRIMASYGLGQVTYWQHFRESALDPFESPGAAASPEVLYDPDLNIQLTAKEIADDRCAWQRNTMVDDPESPRGLYLSSAHHRETDFVMWRQVIAAYNGWKFRWEQAQGAQNYVGRVRDYFEGREPFPRTQPADLFQAGVGIVLGDPPSQTFEGSPCPDPTLALASTGVRVVRWGAYALPGENLLAEISTDLQGDGLPERAEVVWRGDEDVSREGSAFVRLFSDGDPALLVWESPSMDPVTTDMSAIISTLPGGRDLLQLDWYVGAHGTRTYFVQWEGSNFGLVHIVDRTGVDLDHAVSDSGGAFVLRDGSLAVLQRGASPFDQSDVTIFAFDGLAYREARSYVVDRNVVDETPPTSSLTLSPLPNAAGWQRVPVTLTFSANDESAVQLVEYELANGLGTKESLSYVDEFSIEIGEGRWTVGFRGIDIYGNEEAEQEVEVLVDETPPESEAVLQGVMAEDGRYLSPVQVSLLAMDPDLSDGSPGSGVAGIEYSLNGGGTWQAYSEPFSVSGSGVHEVLHRSADQADNVETEGRTTFEISLDEVPPSIILAVYPDRLWPPNHKRVPVRITIDATDEESGLAVVTIRVEDEYDAHEPAIEPMVFAGELTAHVEIVVELIASRLGSDKNGRVYRIIAEATDMAGNVAAATAVVLVPHDQGKGMERK